MPNVSLIRNDKLVTNAKDFQETFDEDNDDDDDVAADDDCDAINIKQEGESEESDCSWQKGDDDPDDLDSSYDDDDDDLVDIGPTKRIKYNVLIKEEDLSDDQQPNNEAAVVPCEVEGCMVQFKTHLELNAHLKIHSEAIKFCKICDFGFINENLLKLHQLLHIKATKEKIGNRTVSRCGTVHIKLQMGSKFTLAFQNFTRDEKWWCIHIFRTFLQYVGMVSCLVSL